MVRVRNVAQNRKPRKMSRSIAKDRNRK